MESGRLVNLSDSNDSRRIITTKKGVHYGAPEKLNDLAKVCLIDCLVLRELNAVIGAVVDTPNTLGIWKVASGKLFVYENDKYGEEDTMFYEGVEESLAVGAFYTQLRKRREKLCEEQKEIELAELHNITRVIRKGQRIC